MPRVAILAIAGAVMAAAATTAAAQAHGETPPGNREVPPGDGLTLDVVGAAARCDRDVHLGVDPGSDAAADAGDAGAD